MQTIMVNSLVSKATNCAKSLENSSFDTHRIIEELFPGILRSYVHRWVVRIFERFFVWQENRFRANPKVRAGSVAAVQMENKP